MTIRTIFSFYIKSKSKVDNLNINSKVSNCQRFENDFRIGVIFGHFGNARIKLCNAIENTFWQQIGYQFEPKTQNGRHKMVQLSST